MSNFGGNGFPCLKVPGAGLYNRLQRCSTHDAALIEREGGKEREGLAALNFTLFDNPRHSMYGLFTHI